MVVSCRLDSEVMRRVGDGVPMKKGRGLDSLSSLSYRIQRERERKRQREKEKRIKGRLRTHAHNTRTHVRPKGLKLK